MQKFSKEFYASRIEDWITKYVKLKELCKLIKTIKKDIEKNGGEIILVSQRAASINIDEEQRNTISSQLDRHTIGLQALEDTEGLFDKDDKIFQSPIMYEINEIFWELKDLEYCDDMKIFLYFLTVEIHNVYVFYLSIEKNIFMRVNEHSNTRKNYKTMSEQELLNELVDLTDITYLMYSFFSYIDLNVKAVQEVLKYFDDHFQILNHNISMNKLYFKKYLSKKDSDLKYILSFKIIIESCALIESYCHDIKEINNSKEIKEQRKELKEVLSYLNEKNMDRVNDDIHEVYLKQKSIRFNNIIKQKKNIKIDMQNSFCVDVHQQEDFYKRLGEKEFDLEINIKTTKKNIVNLIFLFFHIFIYSFFYIMPYLVFFFYFVKNNIHIYFLGFILTSTHLGNFIAKIIINNLSERYKTKVIIFCISFILSFVLSIFSEKFLQKDETDEITFVTFNLISRFIYGFGCGRLLTRKYIIQFIPESEVKFFSIVYLIIIYFGGLSGIILNFLLIDMKPLSLTVFNLYIENYYFIFGIGAVIYIIYLILIIIFFTEPNNATMLKQIDSPKMIEEKEETELNKNLIDDEEKNLCDYKELYEENETGDDTNKLSNLLFRESDPITKRNTTNKESITIFNNEEKNGEEINKTFDERNTKKIEENLSNAKDKNQTFEIKTEKKEEPEVKAKDDEDEFNTPINISEIKKESKNFSNLEFNGSNKKSKDNANNEILSDEEIKGLNSIEKELINMNDKSNFNDINLMPNELERIRKNQFKNNRSYLCSFFVFISTLLLTTSLNEFTLLASPLCFLTKNHKDDLIISEKDVIIIIMILHILSFPFIIFIRMMKTFNVERRLLLAFYAILFCLMIAFLIIKLFLLGGFEHNENSFYFILSIILIYVISNLIEGTTHLLSNKIIPSFIKICNINNRYLISYSSVFGKILGGLIFCLLCLIQNDNTQFRDSYVFKFNNLIFSGITIILFIFFVISYKKLRVRAIAKLVYLND